MNKKTRHISAGAVLILSMLIYNFSKDIFKIGIKDGKATKAAMLKK